MFSALPRGTDSTGMRFVESILPSIQRKVRSCLLPDPCRSKSLWVIMFNSAASAILHRAALASPAFSPIQYAAAPVFGRQRRDACRMPSHHI